MIDQVFVAKRYPEDALSDQRRHFLLDQLRRAAVGRTIGKPIDQPDRPIRRPQQQRSGIRGHLAAAKSRHHRPPFDACKPEQIRATLCRHRVSPLALRQIFGEHDFLRSRGPYAPTPLRNAG
jgi:hypothetical protein